MYADFWRTGIFMEDHRRGESQKENITKSWTTFSRKPVRCSIDKYPNDAAHQNVAFGYSRPEKKKGFKWTTNPRWLSPATDSSRNNSKQFDFSCGHPEQYIHLQLYFPRILLRKYEIGIAYFMRRPFSEDAQRPEPVRKWFFEANVPLLSVALVGHG